MRSWKWLFIAILVAALLAPAFAKTADEDDSDIISAPKVDVNLKGAKVPLKTDDEVVSREEQAMTTEGYTIAEQKLMREQAEKHTFQTEVNKLMHILINSLYSNKEIFLRELISNSSDALDKIRFLALTNPKLLGEGDTANLDIRIKLDKANKTIQITDRGVGMTKEELVKNLGTIAQSGTKEFLQKFSEQGEGKSTSNLIGQFGVGFYSAFLVADTVSVTSKSNEGDQYVWSSDAAGSFTVVKDPQGNTLGRGTRITLHLKEDAAEFLEEDTIKNIAKKYSEFINFPIYLWTSHTEEKEVPIEEDEVIEKKDETIPAEEKKAVEVEDEEDETEEEEKPKTKKITETKWDWELLNQTKPIWTRSPKDITEEEYHNFYKSIAKQTENPLKWIHFTAEGDAEFKSILFIPTTPPSNMFDPTQNTKGHLKLFVRRVFITDDFEGLIPNYLKFIHGIVDSDDLPLNVSREILQQNKLLKLIEKKIVRKSIAMFQELASQEDKESYKQFWSNYGTNIKLGVIEDAGNRSRLTKLLMFQSSKTGDYTSLDDYVGRMKEGQDQIFYLAGSSKEAVERSPLVEQVLRKGYEVLYMVDPIDEYAIHHIPKYDGKHKLTNLGKEGVKLGDEKEDAEAEKKRLDEEFKPLTDYLKNLFSDKLEKVVVTDRLTTTPCTLVSSAYGYSANMERIMKAQALGQGKSTGYVPKKIMEINPQHPIVKELLKRVEEDPKSKSPEVSATVLYETAVLSSGYAVEDPSHFANIIHKMMAMNLDISASDYEAATQVEPPVVDTPPAASAKTTETTETFDKEEL